MYRSKSSVVYPKSTNELFKKFRIGTKRDSGTGVWEMYDTGDYGSIEDRTSREVVDMHAIYRELRPYLWRNGLAQKYNVESFETILQGLEAETVQAELKDYFRYSQDEPDGPRWILRADLRETQELRAATLVFESGYWKKR